jgi:hypothetical protein
MRIAKTFTLQVQTAEYLESLVKDMPHFNQSEYIDSLILDDKARRSDRAQPVKNTSEGASENAV